MFLSNTEPVGISPAADDQAAGDHRAGASDHVEGVGRGRGAGASRNARRGLFEDRPGAYLDDGHSCKMKKHQWKFVSDFSGKYV